MKRSRGRGGRRPPSSNGGGGGGGGNNPNRTYDSNGPEIKIRGSASHVYEKYLQLARDANSSGDRVMAENYLQHAEHYYRLMSAANAQQQQYAAQQPQVAQANGNNGNGRVQANGDGYYNNGASGPSFTLAEGGEEGDEEGDEAAE